MRRLILCLLLVSGASSVQPVCAQEPVRGITVSTHRAGQEWGSEAIDHAYEDLRTVGANWVAIHPYAWIEGDGEVRFRTWDPESPPAHLRRPIEQAHARGLRILIKPHLGYWGSPFSWRGAIEFATAEQWRRFFSTYERWIVAVAAATADADAFAVGTELDRTVAHEREWRHIIARVRAVSEAYLTYAANWTDYRTIAFWDALDAIGVQAYFPLSEAARPAAADLRRGWRRTMAELRAFAAPLGKIVVFTELGYNRSWRAAREPWSAHTDGAEAEALQRLCLAIALEEIEREPTVVGAFLWKWFPPPRSVGRNFQLATPGLRATIRAVWNAPGAGG